METEGRSPPLDGDSASSAPPPTPVVLVVLAWVVVSLPLLWGIFQTLKKAAALFA
ncbi:MAG: hypothetical protein ACLQVI_32880 [Polyangiaceae bacterium]|jgi:hypothetical protein